MWPPSFRTPSGAFLVAVLLVTAGCIGLSPGDETGTQSTSTTAEQTTVPRATYPEPPSNLTNSTAKQVAVKHEEARVQNVVRDEHDLNSFSVGYLRPVDATVVNRSDGGVYVRINATYSYETDRIASDFNPVCSLYHVNQTAIRHVTELGCDT